MTTDTNPHHNEQRETQLRVAAALGLLFGPTAIVVAIILVAMMVAYFGSPLDYLR